MAVEKVSHVFDKATASEYVILRDSHGRELHLRVPILHGPEPNAFIEGEIAKFEQQERDISDHISAHFDPESLKKL